MVNKVFNFSQKCKASNDTLWETINQKLKVETDDVKLEVDIEEKIEEVTFDDQASSTDYQDLNEEEEVPSVEVKKSTPKARKTKENQDFEDEPVFTEIKSKKNSPPKTRKATASLKVKNTKQKKVAISITDSITDEPKCEVDIKEEEPLEIKPPAKRKRNDNRPRRNLHYLCDLCGMTYKRKKEMRKHYDRNLCPKLTKVKKTLVKDQVFPCEVCGKVFGNSHNLGKDFFFKLIFIDFLNKKIFLFFIKSCAHEHSYQCASSSL